MMTGFCPGLGRHEMVYQHDAGVMRLRRYLAREARATIVALQELGRAELAFSAPVLAG